jgi:PBP1b-binding outer membrane lipoprotein LpoB
MTNFTINSLVCAVTTVILFLGGCSSDQATSDMSAPNMKIFTQHLSTIPAKTEVANLSMQFDAEGDLNQHARMVTRTLRTVRNIRG